MCLELKKPEIIVAKEDIICYKVMIEPWRSNGGWVSPYMFMCYWKGDTYELGKQLQLLDFSKTVKEYPYLVEEGFHSFTSLSGAKKHRKHLSMFNHDNGFVIVKCTIPKGTTYVEGLFYSCGTRFHSFCSEKIICEDKVENE